MGGDGSGDAHRPLCDAGTLAGRAARPGRSMEAEIRAILTDTVSRTVESEQLYGVLADRFAALGEVELDVPTRPVRAEAARAPDLSA
jgi:plasmid stability protein